MVRKPVQGEGKSWSSKVIFITSSLRTCPCQLLIATASAVYFTSENTMTSSLGSYEETKESKLWFFPEAGIFYTVGKKEMPQKSEIQNI